MNTSKSKKKNKKLAQRKKILVGKKEKLKIQK
jgi:hypothetical protein